MNIRNVKLITVIEVYNVIMKTKIIYQINENFFYEKNRDRLLQKRNNGFLSYKELQRSYVELQKKLKALEEKVKNE